MLPNESESHALLAEVREKQKRWPEAIVHWERVAEIRSLEPTGLVKLAAAQIEFKDWDAAAKTLRKLRSQSWPPRFNEALRQVSDLEKKLEEQSKPPARVCEPVRYFPLPLVSPPTGPVSGRQCEPLQRVAKGGGVEQRLEFSGVGRNW
jgi:hypothetical protein